MPTIPARELLWVLAAVPENQFVQTAQVDKAVKKAGHRLTGKVLVRLKALEKQGLIFHRRRLHGLSSAWEWGRKYT